MALNLHIQKVTPRAKREVLQRQAQMRMALRLLLLCCCLGGRTSGHFALCLPWTPLSPGTKGKICLQMACGHKHIDYPHPTKPMDQLGGETELLDNSVGDLLKVPSSPSSPTPQLRGTQVLRLGKVWAKDLDMCFRYSDHFTLIIPCDIFTYPAIQPRQTVRHLTKSLRECYWECRARTTGFLNSGSVTVPSSNEHRDHLKLPGTVSDPACLLH